MTTAMPLSDRAALLVNGYDPRSRRLLHALKTLLAVLITCALFWRFDPYTRLLGTIAAAFLMQCVGQGSRRYQRLSMLVTALVMIALTATGALLAPWPLLQYTLLIAVAYGTAEVRRRMPDHNGFTLFCFTMTVIATAYPGGAERAASDAVAMGAAFLVAYPVYFWMAYQPLLPQGAAAPTRRTGLRAAVAAALSVSVALAFGLPRAYWAILTAVVVVAETWKESYTKAAARLGMTAAGCTVAFGVHFLTHRWPEIQLGLMFLFITLAVYFRNGSYPLMTFFITLYVVFLFAAMGQWSMGILEVRLYETAIGCAMSLVASRVVGWNEDGKPAASE